MLHFVLMFPITHAFWFSDITILLFLGAFAAWHTFPRPDNQKIADRLSWAGTAVFCTVIVSAVYALLLR